MAALTHVCMWADNGWKPITAEQAAKSHHSGTVSANSGLFMCELCGQYVTLTGANIRNSYFKHSAYEKSKDCPERTFGVSYSLSYNPKEYDLPIRIIVSPPSFHFEIGLIRVPANLLNNNFCVQIQAVDATDSTFIFSKERINIDSITYLSI